MQKIYAHRGASGYAPENTLEAFALAVEQGADGVELDVHLSADGEIVVTHDESIERVTGERGWVNRMTLSEMKRLRFNRTFPAFEKATIPTLREVFEMLRPTGLSVNVELKTNEFAYDGLAEKCIALADEMGMRERVLYSSFNHATLMHIKEIDPSLPCGLLYEAVMIAPWTYARSLGMDALHPCFQQLALPGFTKDAHAHGMQVNAWTVNEPEHMQRVLAEGADILITNYPDRALSIRGKA